jgi:hypothetical protein
MPWTSLSIAVVGTPWSTGEIRSHYHCRFIALWSRSPCPTSVVFIREPWDEHLVDGEPWWCHGRPRQELALCAPAPLQHMRWPPPCHVELSRPSALAGSACSLMGHEVSSVPLLWAEPGRPASPASWAVVVGFGPWHRR